MSTNHSHGTSKRHDHSHDEASPFECVLPEERYKQAKGPLWFSLIGNGVMFIIKLALGIFIGSIALVAVAVHSISDLGTTVVVMLGIKISTIEGCEKHPYGHGRAEYIVGLITAVLLIVSGFEIGKKSVETIIEGGSSIFVNWWILGLVVLTIIVKEIMGRYTHKVSHDIKSPALLADAWHHRSDALSTLAVLIGLIGAFFGIPLLDSIMGLLVSIIVVIIGVMIGWNNITPLIGRSLTKEEEKAIQGACATVERATEVHNIQVHDYGVGQTVITLHIRIDGCKTIDEGHAIATEIEECLEKELSVRATVHVEPVKKGQEAKECPPWK